MLLATQRSGTHMLRSLLATGADLQVLPEVFHGRPGATFRMPHGLPRFFEFVEAGSGPDCGRGNPEAGPALVSSYLDQLAEAAPAGCRAQVMDIKYNSLHHAEGAWSTPSSPPRMLWILKQRGSALLHLVREDVVALTCSQVRADATGVFVLLDPECPSAPPVRCEPGEFLERLRRNRDDRRVVEAWIGVCGFEVCEIGYESLFQDGPGSDIRPERLREIAGYLGTDPAGIVPRPQTRKVSPARVRDGLENFDEIREFLQDTEFDEAMSAHA